MEASQLRFVLQELNFSADLPPEVLDQLAEESTIRTLAAGTIVFREGAENNDLYLVLRGRIALEMNVPGQGAVRILTIGPGDMAGWSSIVDQGKTTAGAVAVDETEVVVAPADRLLQLCDVNREFGFHLMRQMATALSKRLVATRLQLLDLFSDSPSPVANRPADRQI